MARKPGPGKCVHCLQDFEERNWDHVLPKSWYPDSTPDNLEKWQIPTCHKCNSKHGKLEDELLVMFALTVNPDPPAAAGIFEQAKKSIDEELGRNERDRAARRAKKKRIYAALRLGEEIPDEAIYPGMGERWGRVKSDQGAIIIPAKYITRMCEKFIRGITYRENKILIEPPFLIEFYALPENSANPFRSRLATSGQLYSRGLGFEILRYVPATEPKTGLFKITLWGEIIMYGCISQHKD